MKKVFIILVTAGLLFIQNAGYAQIGNAVGSKAAAESEKEATVSNVLKWTKEVLPKMERLVPKLNKIKADNPGKPASDALRLLATVNHLKEINAKGPKLKDAEAKRYYDLVAAAVNSFYIDCKSQNNNVCCIDCHPHGILGIWCFANCFVARFPGNN
jgi:hypothetical protein